MSGLSADSILFETKHGTAIHCPCCDRYQITYKEFVFLVAGARFGALQEAIAGTARRAENKPRQWRRFAAPTDAGQDAFGLRSEELARS